MGMKIVVIGGSGLIGSKLVEKLGSRGYEAVPVAPNTGVNTLTGEGLAEVLKNASVVVDVLNSPSFEEKVVMEFFQTSRNLLSYEAKAGVGHHVALAELAPRCAAVKLLGHETSVPAPQGVGSGKGGHLFERLPPERIGERRKAPACRVREPQPAAIEVGFEDTVFLVQRDANPLLVPLEPSSNHGHQDVANHCRSSGWRQ